MILMDEMGTKIRASVYPRDTLLKLKEDKAIYIRSPTIAPNRYIFKISDVLSKLNLHGRKTSKTTYDFCCVSFESIISATATSNNSIDVIGEVVSLGKLDSRYNCHIGLQVNVTLFGDIAYQLISYLEAHKEVGRVVVILQFARLNVYNGFYIAHYFNYFNSYYKHTPMFINVDLPEIVTFTDSSQSCNEYDDFLTNHNVKNVVDLLEPQEVGKYIIVGTIYGIRQDIDWYYDACSKCGRKVEPRNVFSGPDSGDASVVVECYNSKCKKRRYLQFQGIKYLFVSKMNLEQSHSLCLIEMLINSSKNVQAGDDPRLYPYDLNCLVHKKMAFVLDVNSFNVSNNYNRFGILGYTLDSNIINVLEKKLAVEGGNSTNADDTKSHLTKHLMKQKATSPFKFNSPTMVKKRNVGDSIDIDEYDNVNSSTKIPRLNSRVDGNTGLLIPKLENFALRGVQYSNIDSSWFLYAANLYLK
uniref:Replication factor A C-terminal domain-containing protein n=1 Tax=Lactuca sativa TaxID=4236 RepID=A0A9R1X7Q3_LACSA|nr:hypothetical protein LSAT_V11C600327640 [Lactuca sativa]